MMDHSHGWMNGWFGGAEWILAIIGIFIIGLLVAILSVLLNKRKNK